MTAMKPMFLGLALLAGGCTGLPSTATEITGVDWVVEELASGPVLDPAASTMIIDAESRVSGSGGCNRYAGAATIEGDKLSFGPLIATKMACAATMQQEAAFLTDLERVRRFRLEQGKLLLLEDDGDRLVVLHRKTGN